MHNHLMVGTRKGIFIYRRSSSAWELKNKGFLGSEVNIVTFDSRDNSIYACLHLGLFGSKIHSSKDGGVSWAEIPVLLTHSNRTIWRRNRILWAKRRHLGSSRKSGVWFLNMHLNLIRYVAEQSRRDCSGQPTPVNPGTL